MAEQPYDIAIAGGGLAGLCCAILLQRQGRRVVLFEKEKYPFHKVCGEYISNESRRFLVSLGVPLDSMDVAEIDTLLLTAPDGTAFQAKLPLGGFGISRYTLDDSLAQIASREGVHLLQETRVDDIVFTDPGFSVTYTSGRLSRGEISARVACGAFGKRSNLDVRWKRNPAGKHDRRLENFIAVKYHIKTGWPANVIGLHNFQDGYCGISRVDGDRFCLCYMTTASMLRAAGNDIRALEQRVLYQNPHLRKIFENASIIDTFPVTISQISFNRKSTSENHVLMLGDAAGMITPLCGNGMSIAMHTAKIAAGLIEDFLSGKSSRKQMERDYAALWDKSFAARLRTGRFLQRFFGSTRLSNGFVRMFRHFPVLARPVIRMTHGKPF